jgi:hypothetical protein
MDDAPYSEELRELALARATAVPMAFDAYLIATVNDHLKRVFIWGPSVELRHCFHRYARN